MAIFCPQYRCGFFNRLSYPQPASHFNQQPHASDPNVSQDSKFDGGISTHGLGHHIGSKNTVYFDIYDTN